MTDVAPVISPAEGGVPEHTPEEPTGADDPFDPVDPEDPYHVSESEDPLASDDPDPDPTTTGGVEIPAPPSAAPSQPPAGHAQLTTAVSNLGSLPDPKNPTTKTATELTAWRTAQEGRFSLSDHWAMIKRIALATAEAAVGQAQDPAKENAKLRQLRQDLGGDGALTKALDAWCAVRDATPIDLTKLAEVAGQLKAAADPLRTRLTTGDLAGVGKQRGLIDEALGGIVSEVASEGLQALAGKRVARGASSDVPTYHLEKMTRDQNWVARLMNSPSWRNAGEMVNKVLTKDVGTNVFSTPIDGRSAKLDLNPLADRLSALDAATKARQSASEPLGYSTRAEVLRRYGAASEALSSQLETLQLRLAAVANKQKPPPGWDAARTQKVADLLAGTARTLYLELAADPLSQDPDLKRGTRTTLQELDTLAGKTSLEARVDKAGSDLRKVWRTAKQSELKALQAAKVPLGDLPSLFDKGLGPLLDQWADQIAVFPRHRPAIVKDLAAQIAEQLHRYRVAINAQLGADRSSRLVEGLDVVAASLVRQIRSFDLRGGLFG
jgi:hypothetical protein